MSTVTIKICYGESLFCLFQIQITQNFLELAETMLTLNHFKKQPPKKFGFVLKDIMIQGEDLLKQFSQYSNKDEDLIFLVDQQLLDFPINNSHFFVPSLQYSEASLFEQDQPDVKLKLIIYRSSETFNLSIDNDQIRLSDLYEYLIEQWIVKKTQKAAFLHQLSASFYEFDNFQSKLSQIPSFAKERQLIYLNDELVDKFRPQVKVEPKVIDNHKVEPNQLSPTRQIQIPQIQNGIIINIQSMNGTSTKNLQYVNMSPHLTVLELKQLIFQNLGYNNPNIVNVDLFLPNGYQLNSSNKQNRSLFDLNLASQEIAIVAKTRWLKHQDNSPKNQNVLKQIKHENGITIDVISEDGPQRRYFKLVMSSLLQIFELQQVICTYLGYNNSEIVDVLLYTEDGVFLNKNQDRISSILKINSQKMTIIAKTRWIGG